MQQKMTSFLIALCAFGFLMNSATVTANPMQKVVNKPVNMYLNNSGWALFNGYQTYTVQCSNGKFTTVRVWKKQNQWCVGETQHQCSGEQLLTANKACEAMTQLK